MFIFAGTLRVYFLHLQKGHMNDMLSSSYCIVCASVQEAFVCVDALNPGQQFFSCVVTFPCLPVLYQY